MSQAAAGASRRGITRAVAVAVDDAARRVGLVSVVVSPPIRADPEREHSPITGEDQVVVAGSDAVERTGQPDALDRGHRREIPDGHQVLLTRRDQDG